MKAGTKPSLLFLPLGGAGEIGMNLNLYGYGPPGEERWIMVDLGVTFGDGDPPGVDVIMPDPTFIVDRRDQLDGLVLTHAHEDHLGAVQYLWDRLRCPVYATPFTANLLRSKLREANLLDAVPLTEVPLSGRFSIGPFDLELITLTHSIPEPNAIAIRTPLGTVLHTGDWKFDPDPVIGPTADEKALRALGEDAVLAMVCDSTNVFEAGTSGSEADLLETLREQISSCEGRVAVTCFASNVARLETISEAARACKRDVVIAGRSLRRIELAARSCGYLKDTPAFIEESDSGYLPKDRTLVICTGSQGEPRAALWRIATNKHPNVTMGAGDTVIFSSRIIPGNEISISRLHNQLIRRGINVVTPRDAFIHVSGHPARDELSRMYGLVRPRIAVPVHGELRHLVEHGRLAKTCQVPQAVVTENGGLVRLAPGDAEVIDTVSTGRLYLEGKRLVATGSTIFKERVRAIHNGVMIISVVVDEDGLVDDPLIETFGLLEEADIDVEDSIFNAVAKTIEDMRPKIRRDDAALREAVRIVARRVVRDRLDKKPETRVSIFRA
jgi:ribonuclease J